MLSTGVFTGVFDDDWVLIFLKEQCVYLTNGQAKAMPPQSARI